MRAVARDTGGAIAVMTALVMPVLIGVAAYAIDASLLLFRQERLQIAADVGAWAGAELLRDGRSDADVIAFARSVATLNAGGAAGSVPEITVTIPDPGRVEVSAVLGVERVFSRIFGADGLTVHAASAAVIRAAAEPRTCVYLDHPDAAAALDVAVNVALTGCRAIVASTGLGAAENAFAPPDKRSVSLGSRGRLAVDCLVTAGRVNRPARVTSDCPGIQERTPVPPPDPLPAAPDISGSCGNGAGQGRAGNTNAALARFRAGRPSCGDVVITGTETLPAGSAGSAGVFVLSGGNLDLRGTARLVLPPGSVLMLKDTARILMNINAELVIDAPTQGALAGIAILAAQDPPRTGNLQHTLGRLDIEGLIALPTETVWIAGDVTAGRCTRIRAGTLAFTGDGTRYVVACPPIDTGDEIILVPTTP